MKSVRTAVAALMTIIAALPASGAAADRQVIFVVRHAERAAATNQAPPSQVPAGHPMMADDPPLSPAGEARAARLATMLASAGIQRIYTTEFKRTRQTAAPLADKLKEQPVMAAAQDPAPLVAQLRQGKGNALVVGHSNTIPDLLKRLGVKDEVKIGDDEYDNLFVVIRRVGEPPTLVRLKY
jgi:broad specificity phosphatase PhoE